MNGKQSFAPAHSLRLAGFPSSGLTFVGSQLLLIHGHEVQVVQVVFVAVVWGRGVGSVGHACVAGRRPFWSCSELAPEMAQLICVKSSKYVCGSPGSRPAHLSEPWGGEEGWGGVPVIFRVQVEWSILPGLMQLQNKHSYQAGAWGPCASPGWPSASGQENISPLGPSKDKMWTRTRKDNHCGP